MDDFFALYDSLLSGMDGTEAVVAAVSGQCWTAVETESSFGMAMTTQGDTAPRMITEEYAGMPLKSLAQASKSWNLKEAGFGMAAVNAYYNTPERLKMLRAYEPFENYCTAGLDLRGQRIGVVGHLNMPESIRQQASELWILERNPKPGDYPDSACDDLLPRCDTVIITASTLVNKTLPHLLSLCRNAYTILTGPSCPMCPELLRLGIQRLSGLVITNRDEMRKKIQSDIPGPPYPMGVPFLLTGERL
ncbi:MAG: Rossmann-like domain-containing protein [Faecousia sp.]